MINFLLDVLRGVVIGLANVIPGVSGGTMMVSMGIYDKLIGSITNLFKDFKRSVITLIPYFLGMGIGIIGFAFAIEWLFERFPIPTALLFIGLIFGGIPMIWNRIKGKGNWLCVVFFVIFFAAVIGLQFLGQATGVDKSLSLSFGHIVAAFFVGVVAAATMIIPGVSGSMVMMILGYYNTIIALITEFIGALTGGDISTLLRCVGILVPFGIGVLIGIFFVAKLIQFLLAKYPAQTFSAILGLICASPIPVYMNAGISEFSVLMIIIGVVTFAGGFFAAYKLGEK